jgi:predicted tellurium resistance membrane protein TerC
MLVLMLIAVVIPIVIMILFAKVLGNFAHSLPSIQILGLSILALIGFMLIAKAADLSYLIIFGNEVATSKKKGICISLFHFIQMDYFSVHSKFDCIIGLF